MTSKELVPVAGKALVPTNQVPLWDAEVKAVLADVHAMALDHDLFPEERRNYRATYESKLRKLTDKMDSGTWPEGPLTPTWPRPKWDTEPLTGRFAELTEADFLDRWSEMTREERIDWMSGAKE